LHGLQAIHEAEKAAVHAIEKEGRGAAWDEVRRNLFGLTEAGGALVSWKAEHGEVGHKAEDAAFMAALGLVAGNLISKDQQAAPVTAPRCRIVAGRVASVLEADVVLVGPEIGQLGVGSVAADNRCRDATTMTLGNLPVLDADGPPEHGMIVESDVSAGVDVLRSS